MAPACDRLEQPPAATLRLTLHDGRCLERPIYAPDEFDLGRNDVKKLFDHVDMQISEHHVRIRCIVFDQDDTSVPPMVYMQVLSRNGVQLCAEGDEKEYLRRSDGARLLNTGDSFKISTSVTVQYIGSRPSLSISEAVQHRTILETKGETYYLTKQTIGSGAFAKVVIAYEKNTGNQLACKILPLRRTGFGVDRSWRHLLDRELNILRVIDHPNIIALRKALWTVDKLYIIQDLATGGDLLSYQQMNGKLKEPEMLSVAYQLIQAVHYLHKLSIVHRDIKPENILLTSWRCGTRIMLADFGQARFLDIEYNSMGEEIETGRMNSIAGTAGWQAPELQVVQRRPFIGIDYGKAVDMWSVGSIIFVGMSGRRLEDWLDEAVARATDTAGRQVLFNKCFDSVNGQASRRAVQFMQHCLQIDEEKRSTAAEAVNHPWFSCSTYKDELVAQYRRAIRPWSARGRTENIIEDCVAQDTCRSDSDDFTPLSLLSSASVGDETRNSRRASILDFMPPRSTQLPET